MVGLWFAVMVAGLVTVGVLTQLGWQLPTSTTARRGLGRVRSRIENARPFGARIPRRRAVEAPDLPKSL
ncbi:hypothetical protein A5765_09830 [Mycolicibacterium celeriflavum]|uniref:Uncharacterized protein n=1 Tax=Mycolicibacterium celeriflavum TaxID=1249101 RepID=A0A1X0BX33_MYCCF|nr:hypothetical protein [Mycolicibacterium celeriflavum]MCV7236938.1 hypothetical protein [Mycolicibacterium celeriflavum]OBG14902.1 hypothetical protein A5765_09830 [Mycolicibacterium celeriflavum]ORA48891.1 hypothetical protein BST21_09510 [Mycolicibacterium celeriflavum]BBY42772.1 hypothetical protein MCEL_10670 [Mycolicibacterium celeriflavum]